MNEGHFEHLKAKPECACARKCGKSRHEQGYEGVFARYVGTEPEGEKDPNDASDHEVECDGNRRNFQHF